MKIFFLISLIIFSFSCQKIKKGSGLSVKTIKHIKNLGLLDENEKIIKFYSEYKETVAGSFFTNKRMANYWIDETDSSKNSKDFAFYPDIISIDTNYMENAWTFAPYMEVTRKDSSRFKLYAEGKKEELMAFFGEAIAIWKAQKNK